MTTNTKTTTETILDTEEFIASTPALQQQLPPAQPSSQDATRAMFLKMIEEACTKRCRAIRAEVEDTLRGNQLVANALTVSDYFVNAPPGVPLVLHNCNSPAEALKPVIQSQAVTYGMHRVGLIGDLDAEGFDQVDATLNALGETIDGEARVGNCALVMATIEPRPYGQLVRDLSRRPVLGTQPQRESLSLFVDRITTEGLDENSVVARSPVGAALGKRISLDARFHIGEPMAYDRGGKGVLRGVRVVNPPGQATPFLEEQRGTLASHGVNTIFSWTGVGSAVIATQRSLRDGDSVFNYVTSTSLRAYVQSVFRKTVEHQIREGSKADITRIEGTVARMNDLLGALVAQQRLHAGNVTIIYEHRKIVFDVAFTPTTPNDHIEIIFGD